MDFKKGFIIYNTVTKIAYKISCVRKENIYLKVIQQDIGKHRKMGYVNRGAKEKLTTTLANDKNWQYISYNSFKVLYGT